ncbi:hypothetical protein F5Y03DRAFT_351071 [Xylaria venustula]|nr:hypothetical protein F5Y03DRAFT_351071 [Xylaria venustula]
MRLSKEDGGPGQGSNRGPRHRGAAIGPCLRCEVSLSNQLTPSAAGDPARTPDQPANQKRPWRPGWPTPLSVKCRVAARRPIATPHFYPQSSISILPYLLVHLHRPCEKLWHAHKSV